MNVIRYQVGELQANAYLLINNTECVVIDPGDEGAFLLEEILRRNLKLVALIATHGHFDHVMAAGEIQLSYNVPLYIHKKDMFLLDRMEETAKHFLGYQPTIINPTNVNYFKNRTLHVSHYTFQVVETPGHTPGSCCFITEDMIFTGDTLFKDGVGSTDHSYSNKKDLSLSLKRIRNLVKSGYIVHPGHGEAFMIE